MDSVVAIPVPVLPLSLDEARRRALLDAHSDRVVVAAGWLGFWGGTALSTLLGLFLPWGLQGLAIAMTIGCIAICLGLPLVFVLFALLRLQLDADADGLGVSLPAISPAEQP